MPGLTIAASLSPMNDDVSRQFKTQSLLFQKLIWVYIERFFLIFGLHSCSLENKRYPWIPCTNMMPNEHIVYVFAQPQHHTPVKVDPLLHLRQTLIVGHKSILFWKPRLSPCQSLPDVVRLLIDWLIEGRLFIECIIWNIKKTHVLQKLIFYIQCCWLSCELWSILHLSSLSLLFFFSRF